MSAVVWKIHLIFVSHAEDEVKLSCQLVPLDPECTLSPCVMCNERIKQLSLNGAALQSVQGEYPVILLPSPMWL